MTETRGHIRFATNILRRLGEELNPTVDQGLLELVKNAYDADALSCVVEILPGPSDYGIVRVSDDGRGMDVDGILNGWLVLGASSKEDSGVTRLGRVPAGNKGLGRLAALRMGHVAELTTRKHDARQTLHVRLEWDKFDHAELVDQIDVPVVSTDDPGAPFGTVIAIKNLRRRIGRIEVRRLARAMILLADPFSDIDSGFQAILRAPEYGDLERQVSSKYFSDAEYHLVGVLRNGIATAEVRDWRDNVLFSAEDVELNRAKSPYGAPDTTFDLWSFSLRGEIFATRSAGLSEVRTWLESFGGVHVYANGLRVAPYGNPGNDWLEMNVARARSPEERPSTNNSIGRLTTTSADGLLGQKTDRSGFIENETYDELRRFAIDCLEWMARRRLAIAETKREHNRVDAAAKVEPSREIVEAQIARVDPAVQPELTSAFANYTAARDREANALRKEVQLYRTLSTAGITAATFAHESNGGPLKIIVQAIGAVRRRGKKALGEQFDAQLSGPIERIERATDALAVLSQATLRLVDQDKRRVGRVDLDKVVAQVLVTFTPFLEGRDVKTSFDAANLGAYLRGSEAALESILSNLINNSLSAFETADHLDRRLTVTTKVSDADWILTVSDNGPGITGISTRDIWLPGQTRRQGGTGLGLTIVRDSVRDLGGTVSAKAHGEYGGAEFTIALPILGTEVDH